MNSELQEGVCTTSTSGHFNDNEIIWCDHREYYELEPGEEFLDDENCCCGEVEEWWHDSEDESGEWFNYHGYACRKHDYTDIR